MLGMSLFEGSKISDGSDDSDNSQISGIGENIKNNQNSQSSEANQDISKLDPLMNRPRISTIALCA